MALNDLTYSFLLGQGAASGDGSLEEPVERIASAEFFSLTAYNRFLQGGYNGCQETKGCFGVPAGCIETRDCAGYATYSTNADGRVLFNLIGEDVPSNAYVAFALSDDDLMAEASVMYCFADQEDLSVGRVVMAWNPQERDCIPLDDPEFGLDDIEGSYVDGVLTCSFIRDQITDISLPDSGEVRTFDLSQDYFFLAAYGPMDERNPDPIKIFQHDIFSATSEAANLADFATPGSGENRLRYIKWHASLMVVAWYFLAANGIFIARYGKQQFYGIKIWGKDVWFRIHQAFMTSTWVFTLTAAMIMVYRFQFLPLDALALDANPHAIVGWVATGFMFIQPFMSLMRCHPGDRLRPVFDYAHSLVGLSALVLGSVAIYLATDDSFFTKIPLTDAARYFTITHLAILGMAHLFLTAYSLNYKKFFKEADHKLHHRHHPKDEDEMPKSDSDKDISDISEFVEEEDEKKGKKEDRPDPVILLTMVVYFLFNIAFTVAMVFYIADTDISSIRN